MSLDSSARLSVVIRWVRMSPPPSLIRAPQRSLGLALIDGGVLLETPGAGALMDAALKPVIERLRTTYNSVSDYLKFWYSMTQIEAGPLADQYLLYDLGFTPEGYRPKCSYDAAAADWRDLLNNPATAGRLASVKCPILAVGAEMGLTPNASFDPQRQSAIWRDCASWSPTLTSCACPANYRLQPDVVGCGCRRGCRRYPQFCAEAGAALS